MVHADLYLKTITVAIHCSYNCFCTSTHRHNLGNIAFLMTVCLHINLKVHVACNLNFLVKDEGLIKVTGSRLYWKSDNMLETVLDGDDVTSGH